MADAEPAALAAQASGLCVRIGVALDAAVVHRHKAARLAHRALRLPNALRLVAARGDAGDASALLATLEALHDFLDSLGTVRFHRRFMARGGSTLRCRELHAALDDVARSVNAALGAQGRGHARLGLAHGRGDAVDQEDDLKELLDQLLLTSEAVEAHRGERQRALTAEFHAMKAELTELFAVLEANGAPGAVHGALRENCEAVLARDEAVRPAHEVFRDRQQVLLSTYEQHDWQDIGNLLCIGEGAFGKVFRADSAGGHIAVKQLGEAFKPESEAEMRKLLNELLVQAAAVCPNVVQMYGFKTVRIGPQDDSLCLLMEYAEYGSLHSLLSACSGRKGTVVARDGDADVRSRLTVPTLLMILLDIANGIEDIHRQCVIHRDLRPRNILFAKGFRVKISDFGLSKEYTGTLCKSIPGGAGTERYMAPEMLSAVREEGGPEYGYTADTYSFGVVLHDLCHAAYGGGSGSRLDDPVPSILPAGLEAVRQRCLTREPRDRFGRGTSHNEPLSAVLQTMLLDAGGDPREATTRSTVEGLHSLIYLCRALQRTQEHVAQGRRPSTPPSPQVRPTSLSLTTTVPSHQSVRGASSFDSETPTVAWPSDGALDRESLERISEKLSLSEITDGLSKEFQRLGVRSLPAKEAAKPLVKQGFHTLADLDEPWRELGEEAFFQQFPMVLAARLKLKAFLTERGAPPLLAEADLPAALRRSALQQVAPGPVRDAMNAVMAGAGSSRELAAALQRIVDSVPDDVSGTRLHAYFREHRQAAKPFFQAGIVDTASWSLGRYPGDPSLVCVALRLLTFGACAPGPAGDADPRFASATTVDLVTGAMLRHADHAEVQAQALAAMGAFGAYLPVANDSFMAAGAPELIVAAMRGRPAHPRIQHHACAAVRNLSIGSDDRRESMMAAGAAERIVGAMKAFREHEQLQHEACSALASLSFVSAGEALVSAGGVVALAAAMRRFAAHRDLQLQGCWAVGNLAHMSEDAKDALMAADAPELLLTAMREFPEDAQLQHRACAAIWCLVAGGDEARREAFAAAGAADLVIAAVFSHAEHEGTNAVARRAAKALGVVLSPRPRPRFVRGQVR